jgi:hypothetical protein
LKDQSNHGGGKSRAEDVEYVIDEIFTRIYGFESKDEGKKGMLGDGEGRDTRWEERAD